jgi:hypothetical protein
MWSPTILLEITEYYYPRAYTFDPGERPYVYLKTDHFFS